MSGGIFLFLRSELFSEKKLKFTENYEKADFVVGIV